MHAIKNIIGWVPISIFFEGKVISLQYFIHMKQYYTVLVQSFSVQRIESQGSIGEKSLKYERRDNSMTKISDNETSRCTKKHYIVCRYSVLYVILVYLNNNFRPSSCELSENHRVTWTRNHFYCVLIKDLNTSEVFMVFNWLFHNIKFT